MNSYSQEKAVRKMNVKKLICIMTFLCLHIQRLGNTFKKKFSFSVNCHFTDVFCSFVNFFSDDKWTFVVVAKSFVFSVAINSF